LEAGDICPGGQKLTTACPHFARVISRLKAEFGGRFPTQAFS